MDVTGHGQHRPQTYESAAYAVFPKVQAVDRYRSWVSQAVGGTGSGWHRPGHNTSVVSLYMLLWLSPV